MKHIKSVTQQQPQAAQTVLAAKLQALSLAIPAALQLWNDKYNGGAYPL
jgi:hypothetical protein